MMCAVPIITQSVGVPVTAKRCASISRNRSGRDSVRECEAPDCSLSGATTQTSSVSACAMRSATARPGAWIPSSLVTRMRIALTALLRDPFEAAHIGAQRLGDGNGAVALLIILHDRHDRAADGEAGAVQRMDEARLLGAFRPVT